MKEVYANDEGVFFDGQKVATINEDVLRTTFFAFCDELEKIGLVDELERRLIRLKDALVNPEVLDGIIEDVKDLSTMKTAKERAQFAKDVVARIEYIQKDLEYTLEMS